MKLLARRSARSSAEAEARDKVQAALTARIRDYLGVGEDDVVKIAEIACGAANCPDIETAVLVMRQGQRTQAYKIALPMLLIEDADIAEALNEARVASGRSLQRAAR